MHKGESSRIRNMEQCLVLSQAVYLRNSSAPIKKELPVLTFYQRKTDILSYRKILYPDGDIFKINTRKNIK